MTYTTPKGEYYTLFKDMLDQKHLLVVGATGSGKSVVINGIMYTALYQSPNNIQFILIDPKRVELLDYAQLPHTINYSTELDEIMQALEYAVYLIDCRYDEMKRLHIKKYIENHIYIVIDELADIMTTIKRQAQPLLQRIAQIGRAANVHIIAATQCPLASVIPTPIKVNFDSCVALRTRSAQDSRNILGVNGCESLPEYGQGYYMTPKQFQLYNIPYTTDEQIQAMVSHWINQKPWYKKIFTW